MTPHRLFHGWELQGENGFRNLQTVHADLFFLLVKKKEKKKKRKKKQEKICPMCQSDYKKQPEEMVSAEMQCGGSGGRSKSLVGLWKKSQRMCRTGEEVLLSFALPMSVQLEHHLKVVRLSAQKHDLLHSLCALGVGQKVMGGNQ